MRSIYPFSDKNEIYGIAFSNDGTRGFIYGAEVTST